MCYSLNKKLSSSSGLCGLCIGHLILRSCNYFGRLWKLGEVVGTRKKEFTEYIPLKVLYYVLSSLTSLFSLSILEWKTLLYYMFPLSWYPVEVHGTSVGWNEHSEAIIINKISILSWPNNYSISNYHFLQYSKLSLMQTLTKSFYMFSYFSFFNIDCFIKFCLIIGEIIGLSENIYLNAVWFHKKCFTVKTDEKSERWRRQ